MPALAAERPEVIGVLPQVLAGKEIASRRSHGNWKW